MFYLEPYSPYFQYLSADCSITASSHLFCSRSRSQVRRKVLGYKDAEYVPDFTKCVDKFAIHAGRFNILLCAYTFSVICKGTLMLSQHVACACPSPLVSFLKVDQA